MQSCISAGVKRIYPAMPETILYSAAEAFAVLDVC